MADFERETVADLERRLASLESTVRALTVELQRLRDAPPPALAQTPLTWDVPAAAPVEPAARRTPEPWPEITRSGSWMPANVDLESLVGRYGTLVLSTISALAAVGLFLNWAIEKGFLGPQQRLGLGLVTAATLAVAGLRLRRRERSFGASILGLALAITLVCAWGAGPALNLVPDWSAFLFAAVTSIALAVFAHAENDEPLWCVGFSGAAVAPFVTANGRADLLLLASYGVAVLASAGYAMNARRWIVAGRLFLLAAAAYTAALATGFERDFGPLLATAFPLAVALAGVIPWSAGWSRRERLRAVGVLAALAAIRTGLGTNHPIDDASVAMAIAIAGLVWLVIVDRTHAVREPVPSGSRHLYEGDWLDAAVLPLGFTLAALAALDATAQGSGQAMAAAAGVLLLTVMRAPHGGLRDASVFATVICALVANMLLMRDYGAEQVGAIAGLCVLCFAANRLWRSGSWTTLALIGLGWCMVASLQQLVERPEYEYAPFMTQPSLIALSVLAATLASMALAVGDPRLKRWLLAGAAVWAFVWVHQEILFAYNETAATLLRVAYYAASAVAGVWIGRTHQLPGVRHIGLALAVLAAGTALYGARGLDAVAARITAHAVAAVFLLAIAYWYRRPGGTTHA
ncbi:MAG: DUF2339 domain-containing protein [Gemmatimonadaceae bacterium]